jgi:hypothetical protein
MKMDPTYLTNQQLRKRLSYDPNTGEFHWLESTRPGWVGKRAGSILNSGYRVIDIDGQSVLAHRMAWFFAHGEWPEHEVDHKNTHRDENWISNLRKATKFQNQANASRRVDNTSGVKGVTWNVRRGAFTARIQSNHKRVFLGYFQTRAAASEAYAKASNDLHQDFGRVA